MAKQGTLRSRPYARLLTMLSDQLIKDNVVALTELAKNSYDADADWVSIRIGNMANFRKENLAEQDEPFVEVEDDGDGMTLQIIRESWMNPATPVKYSPKGKEKRRTEKGRIVQGEKGIGRYAAFKIGKKVEIFTRPKKGKNHSEVELTTDLSGYDEELIGLKKDRKKAKGGTKPLFLDQLRSTYSLSPDPSHIKPEELVVAGIKVHRKNHGTLIKITSLNYRITFDNAGKIKKTLSRLQSPFHNKNDLIVGISYDGEDVQEADKFKLKDVLDDALLVMQGDVNEKGICNYVLGKKPGNLDLVDNLKNEGYLKNRFHFFDDKLEKRTHDPQCGPFKFKFYTYDIENITDREFNNYVKEHRVYLYRDGIRVYPYGDPDNDWLQLDVLRGYVRASYYLSNDQTLGYVDISANANPNLRDKTNREGLLEETTAYEDLRLLLLSALNFLNTEFRKEKAKNKLTPSDRKRRQGHLFVQSAVVKDKLQKLSEHLQKVGDKASGQLATQLEIEYSKEIQIYRNQIEQVEDLAGVGMAVDATSHDVKVAVDRAIENARVIERLFETKSVDIEKLRDKTDALLGQLLFIDSLLIGIQPLFRSTGRRRKDIRIKDIIETVKRYYQTVIDRNSIDLQISEVNGTLVVNTAEGVLLQVFINLFDNACHWLQTISHPRKIEVLVDGSKGHVTFADNGPGVREDDVPYIFEPFFSTKGLHGRGLGLYIARQLTDRYEYDLYYISSKRDQILDGANFGLDFFAEGK